MTTSFNFSMGTLTQRADRIDNLLERDAEQLSPLGYDETFRTNFKTNVTAFRQMPSDNYWLGQQTLKTDAKNKAYAQVKELLSTLRFRCKYALGEQSVEYKAIRFNKLKDVKAADLINLANHICTTCREMLDKLASRNITEETLTEIEAAVTVLDDAIDEQQTLISTREAKTVERERAANEIYRSITEICEAGKDIWEGVNEAYYNDYVIYGSKDTIEEDEPVEEDEETIDNTVTEQ